MGKAFDEAWDTIEPEYTNRRDAEIELARLALAKAVVLFAGLGNNDPETLKHKALKIVQAPRSADSEFQAPSLKASSPRPSAE
jgi:hypothetical protein